MPKGKQKEGMQRLKDDKDKVEFAAWLKANKEDYLAGKAKHPDVQKYDDPLYKEGLRRAIERKYKKIGCPVIRCNHCAATVLNYDRGGEISDDELEEFVGGHRRGRRPWKSNRELPVRRQ